MNIINVAIDFTNGTNKIAGINLVTGDYASTKIVFSFDRTDGRKVFELRNPSGQVVYAGDIVNNEVVLAGEENGEVYSVFNEAGYYIYEVSLYNGNSKLTSTKGQLPVDKEQVVIGNEVVEPYLPIFDELMQEINTAITETNNLNISVDKEEGITTIVLTKKNGDETDTIIEDLQFRWDGTRLGIKTSSQTEYQYVDLKGAKGDAGAIKMLIVAELPSTGADDTIYLVPAEDTETGNNYAEYVYINGAWELLGKIGVQIDLTDYVKNTDYATASKGGVIKSGYYGLQVDSTNGKAYCDTYTYANYGNVENQRFIGKGTLSPFIVSNAVAISPTKPST